MTAKHKFPDPDISIIEAVETLSHIADIEFDADIGITEKHDLVVQGKEVTYRTVHWLHRQDPDETITLIKKTFRVVLKYLRNFYREDFRHIGNKQTLDGIKTIMVLVGEAAKKLDRYTTLFKDTKGKSVTDLREYKRLQEFYLSKIARKIDEGTLGKWILGLTKQALDKKEQVGEEVEKVTSTKYVFVDLESVKRDTEYELFLLRKEDGTRFYNPRLIRNIKLVCDFGDYFKGFKGSDPFLGIQLWQDRVCQITASFMLQSISQYADRFYREAVRNQRRDLVPLLNKAIMALMMSANPRNLLRNSPVKSCQEYFTDFQVFLRKALMSGDYQKLITYPPKKSNRVACLLLSLCHKICNALYDSSKGYIDLVAPIETVQEKAEDVASKSLEVYGEDEGLSHFLKRRYRAMERLIKMHQSGPLTKVIDILEKGGYQSFDPLLQGNIPAQLFSLYVQEHLIPNIRIPSPTHQEFIHKSQVVDEFKGFLRAITDSRVRSKHLLFNFQDRTSWKEHFRSTSIENLPKIENFKKSLEVVTLAKDTEFYHQLAPYHEDNRAEVFIQHFKEHLKDENSGFYFPESIKKKIFPSFVNNMLNGIHRVFFGERNVLLREKRLDFIELFYFFLEMKIIELVKPSSFSFTCKDGIDVGGAASALMFAFMKLISQDRLTEVDREEMNLILYGPSLLIRERLMNPERFNRMLSVLKTTENLKEEFGSKNFKLIIHEAFGDFYETPILDSLLIPPHKESISFG